MADGFEHMIHEARAFYADLSRNNNREWYEAHKDRFVEGVKKPAEFFAGLIAEDLARVTGNPVKPKVFRIHRDVRFSKDKTPYKTHLHMLWAPVDGGALTPRWFCGVAEGYFIVGMGVMGLDGEALTKFRQFIDRDGDALADAIAQASSAADARISDWGPAPLKRVPKPYEADHPHGELLKRKALTVTAEMPEDWEQIGLVKAVNQRIGDLLPIHKVFASA